MSDQQQLKRTWTSEEAEAYLREKIDGIWADFQRRAEDIPLNHPDFSGECSRLQRAAQVEAEPLYRVLIRLLAFKPVPPIFIPASIAAETLFRKRT